MFASTHLSSAVVAVSQDGCHHRAASFAAFTAATEWDNIRLTRAIALSHHKKYACAL